MRIYKHVEEKPIAEDIALREERVTVERRPADRPATEADLRTGERTVEMTDSAEEPVISKQARVVEEVVVGKEVSEKTEKVRDNLRRTSVDVQPGTRETTVANVNEPNQYDADFRKHCQATFPNSRYEEYSPAYDFGSRMANDSRYRGQTYNEIEPNIRQVYEASNPSHPWERIKAAVRYAWERVTGKSARGAGR